MSLPRIAIPAAFDDTLLQSFPSNIDLIRYQPNGTEPLDVDMIVLSNYDPNAAEVLTRTRARFVQAMSAGVESIQPHVPPGARLCNARGVHDSSTAEWVLTAILASLKWLPFYGALQGEGRWGTRADGDRHWQEVHGGPPLDPEASPVMLEQIAGATVLIVGYGAIGKAIEARLLPFEPARILRVARTTREGVSPVSDLRRLLPEADIIVLITPLTPDTRHLIGREEIDCMRPGALLVNGARGAVVDTDALVSALEARRIRAALDVTDPEPLPADHPLWRAPGVLITPHIAGFVPSLLPSVFRFLGQQAQRLVDGTKPENIIRGSY